MDVVQNQIDYSELEELLQKSKDKNEKLQSQLNDQKTNKSQLKQKDDEIDKIKKSLKTQINLVNSNHEKERAEWKVKYKKEVSMNVDLKEEIDRMISNSQEQESFCNNLKKQNDKFNSDIQQLKDQNTHLKMYAKAIQK
mgnify:CR=1 FL=1